MLQWAQGMAKTWKLGECLTSCTFFRWHRKQISKVVYDWWCYFNDVWKNVIWNITLEWPQINEWKSPCLMASLSIGFLHNGRCHGFRKPIHGPFHSLICGHSNFKGGLWVMLLRWCVKIFIWNITLECGHSKVIFHMKFFTHHRKNITNHKPPLKFVSYVTWRKCITSNIHLIFMF